MVASMAPPYSRDHHREAIVEYLLVTGAFQFFSATIAPNPLFKESMVPIVFRVLGDGKELFRSKPFRPKQCAEDIEVSLGRIRWLTLTMHYAKNPTRSDVMRTHCGWATHGVWADAILVNR